MFEAIRGLPGGDFGGVLDVFDLLFGKWLYVGLRNQGISMIPGSEPILLDLEKLFLLSDE